jgi:hypothetical protein
MNEPDRSVFSDLPTFEWDDQSMTRFETTQDVIGQVVAVYTGLITAEQSRPDPDQEAIRRWEAEQDKAVRDRQRLRVTDPAEVDRVCDRYVALLRDLRHGDAE